MKKLILTVISAVFVIAVFAKERQIEYSQLPISAKNFVTKYFSKAKVTAAMIDEDPLSKDYIVYLDNGTKIEFTGHGVWTEVDCGTRALPTGIVPAKIASYVKSAYGGVNIMKIELDANGYDIRLSNGLELKFNSSQIFMGIDD